MMSLPVTRCYQMTRRIGINPTLKSVVRLVRKQNIPLNQAEFLFANLLGAC